MKSSSIKPNKAIRILLIAGLSMTSIAPSVLMAETNNDNEVLEMEGMVFDSTEGLFLDCIGTTGATDSETKDTFSCTTPGGRTTECEKGRSSSKFPCSTSLDKKRVSPNGGTPRIPKPAAAGGVSTGANTAPAPTIVKPFVKLHVPMKRK